MPDDVITRAGPVAVPLSYQVPTGTEIIPRAISASFDGSAAAGAFVPVLEVIAPSGIVTAYCARQVAYAAGESVLVSWFPGVAEADQASAAPAAGGTIDTIASPLGTLTVNGGQGPTTLIDMPATGVVAGSYGDASDAVTVTVDAEGRITAAGSVPIAGGGTVVASDGWVPDTTETWAYASFAAGPPAVGTFTVAGDLRAKYTVGTRIRLVQTTTKYFVVVADPTYDGTNTTVSISGGTDYTLANAAISANYHSYVLNPQGYPDWFNFAAAATGFSSKSSDAGVFRISGRVMDVLYAITGVSNAATFTATWPVVPIATQTLEIIVTDSTVTAAGRVLTAAGSSTATFGKAVSASGGFTSSGVKGTSGISGAFAGEVSVKV